MNIFFAGQITGVEGYVESISSGVVAAINACEKYNNSEKIRFPETTMIGALAKYISTENDKFQPMNANFGIVPELGKRIIVCMRNDETHFDNVFGVNEIAENLETTQKSINGALRKLVNDGFVEKINTTPKKYKLTDKGLNEKLELKGEIKYEKNGKQNSH